MSSLQQDTLTRLGLWGLVPLAAGAVGVWLSPWILPGGIGYDLGETSLLYAGAVASYLAGVGAGGVLGGKETRSGGFLPAMIAVLAAWVAMWPVGALFIRMPDVARYLLMIGVFVYLLMRDRRAVHEGALPVWYGALRTRLTFWACLLLAMIMTRLLV